MLKTSMPPLAPLDGNTFSGSPLDRFGLLRKNKAWLSKLFSDPDSVFLPYWNEKHLVEQASNKIIFFPKQKLSKFFDGNEEIVFLGMRIEDGSSDGPGYFAVDLSHIPENSIRECAPNASLLDIRQAIQIISNTDASIIGCARGLLYWHSRAQHCGICGHETKSSAGGYERICKNLDCGKTQFPRTDPAVIVLVHNENSCLLGRQSWWPAGMHSTLAGFLEPGESLEEAVRREIMEESGVLVSDITYHSSQPWPLPGSLMVGFKARAHTLELNIDYQELERAIWITREELIQIKESDSFRLPGKYSIARRLIEDWLKES